MNMDDVCSVWHEILWNQLKVQSEEHPVIATLPIGLSQSDA
jgi:hypothetical protein